MTARILRLVAGAEQLQRALGYRFELDQVCFTSTLEAGGALQVSVDIRNSGSAPFYENWPLELSLLDPITREVVWSDTFKNADPREWQPGKSMIEPNWEHPEDVHELPRAHWPKAAIENWCKPPLVHRVQGSFHPEVNPGRYILALALLDPAGMRPTVQFATTQYWNGGRHPMGVVAVGGESGGLFPKDMTFDDPIADHSLGYLTGR